MPYLPVDTAIVVEIGPCLDDTDMKTLETAIAYNASGMSVDLIKNSGTAISKVDLTLTASGDNDWTHVGNGVYQLEITAAQNNTEGTLRVVGVCDGVLPFESPVYTVVPTQVYNSLVKGTDRLNIELYDTNYGEMNNLIAQWLWGDTYDFTPSVSVRAFGGDADNLGIWSRLYLGSDYKVLISTDAQDLSGSLDVNAKTLESTLDFTSTMKSSIQTAVAAIFDAANTELSAVPGYTGSLRQMVQAVFQLLLKKLADDRNNSEIIMYKSDGTTELADASYTDSSGIMTRGDF